MKMAVRIPELRSRILNDLVLDLDRYGIQTEMATKYKVSIGYINKLVKIIKGEEAGFMVLASKQGYCSPQIVNSHEMLYIKVLLIQQPSLYLKEIQMRLFLDLGITISISRISVLLKNLGYSFKKMIRINERRLIPENIEYRFQYLCTVSNLNIHQLYFYDESGFVPLTGLRKYGHAIGRAVESQ